MILTKMILTKMILTEMILTEMILKTAKVVPVFKSGDKHDFTNYRPISLLSSFAKLLEKIVSKQVFGFLYKHRILYKHQYGFRKGHVHLFDRWFDCIPWSCQCIFAI